MTFEEIRAILAWCIVINSVLLLCWWIIVMIAGDFVCSMHAKMFRIPKEKVATKLYACMVFYKMAIILFNLVPYLAMRIFVDNA